MLTMCKDDPMRWLQPSRETFGRLMAYVISFSGSLPTYPLPHPSLSHPLFPTIVLIPYPGLHLRSNVFCAIGNWNLQVFPDPEFLREEAARGESGANLRVPEVAPEAPIAMPPSTLRHAPPVAAR
jgi:hypothetical protein